MRVGRCVCKNGEGGWEFLDVIKKLTTDNQNMACYTVSMVVGSSRSVQGRTTLFFCGKDLDQFELIMK